MIVKQVFNNNVVLVVGQRGREAIVMGKGIGFCKKKGDRISSKSVERVFSIADNPKLTELINQIPAEYLELSEDIISFAEQEYGLICDESVYVILTDHLYFALDREKSGIELDNPFLADVMHYYKLEWRIALYAQRVIREKFSVAISQSEVGFIALHIIEASRHQDRRSFRQIFEIVDEIMGSLRQCYPLDCAEDSLAYTRLINHVKYFAQRYVECGGGVSDAPDELLVRAIRGSFPEERACIDRLSTLLDERYGKEMTESEKNYLALHLRNCRNRIAR